VKCERHVTATRAAAPTRRAERLRMRLLRPEPCRSGCTRGDPTATRRVRNRCVTLMDENCISAAR
jgi:hypothetical protein